ncbi:MAG: hypothetical protein ACRDTX_16665 [Pseudonocardiaceae bacterium]
MTAVQSSDLEKERGYLVLILDGTPGAGKTTLLGRLLESLPEKLIVFPEAQPPTALSGDAWVVRALLAEDRARIDSAARLHAVHPTWWWSATAATSASSPTAMRWSTPAAPPDRSLTTPWPPLMSSASAKGTDPTPWSSCDSTLPSRFTVEPRTPTMSASGSGTTPSS